jgi:hypothetical protein
MTPYTTGMNKIQKTTTEHTTTVGNGSQVSVLCMASVTGMLLWSGESNAVDNHTLQKHNWIWTMNWNLKMKKHEGQLDQDYQ